MTPVIEATNIALSNVKAFFTTKILVNNHEDINDALGKELNISKDNIYLPIQKHTNKIHILDSDNRPVIADAVITDKKHVLIGVLVADCVPILLHDKLRGVIGAVHAGWRGTATQILKKTIMTMQERFRSLPEDISVAIGPSIRQCSYEVDEDVNIAVQEATGEGDYYRRQGNKYYVDLSSANRIQALSMGVPSRNIWQSDECTFCRPEKYYSYRYSGGSSGRQGGFIGLW
jgi:YfiH family protein